MAYHQVAGVTLPLTKRTLPSPSATLMPLVCGELAIPPSQIACWPDSLGLIWGPGAPGPVAFVGGRDDRAPVRPVVVGVVAGIAIRQLLRVEDSHGGPVREVRRIPEQADAAPLVVVAEDLSVGAVAGASRAAGGLGGV